MTKRRLTVSVEPELAEAGARAVATGAAESLSAWVSEALAERIRRDAKLAALRDAVTAFEAEFGTITPDEIARQRRVDRDQAIVVRGPRTKATKTSA